MKSGKVRTLDGFEKVIVLGVPLNEFLLVLKGIVEVAIDRVLVLFELVKFILVTLVGRDLGVFVDIFVRILALLFHS